MMTRRSKVRSFFEDASRGLEYNRITMTRRVSRMAYSVDIARTPMVVRDDFVRPDVQDECGYANSERYLIDKKVRRFKGRQ